jgi:hypothetical protein
VEEVEDAVFQQSRSRSSSLYSSMHEMRTVIIVDRGKGRMVVAWGGAPRPPPPRGRGAGGGGGGGGGQEWDPRRGLAAAGVSIAR